MIKTKKSYWIFGVMSLALMGLLGFQNCTALTLVDGRRPSVDGSSHSPGLGESGGGNGDSYGGMTFFFLQPGFQCTGPDGREVLPLVKYGIGFDQQNQPLLIDPCTGTKTPILENQLTYLGTDKRFISYNNVTLEKFSSAQAIPTPANFRPIEAVCISEVFSHAGDQVSMPQQMQTQSVLSQELVAFNMPVLDEPGGGGGGGGGDETFPLPSLNPSHAPPPSPKLSPVVSIMPSPKPSPMMSLGPSPAVSPVPSPPNQVGYYQVRHVLRKVDNDPARRTSESTLSRFTDSSVTVTFGDPLSISASVVNVTDSMGRTFYRAPVIDPPVSGTNWEISVEQSQHSSREATFMQNITSTPIGIGASGKCFY